MNKFQYMLSDFGVSTEAQLEQKMIKESETVPCIYCHREMTYAEVYTFMGDPVCHKHYVMLKGS